tara:strand:- start:1047 stop:1451 length:405 start_codon:yes stop_codon:yes gene_type:complete
MIILGVTASAVASCAHISDPSTAKADNSVSAAPEFPSTLSGVDVQLAVRGAPIDDLHKRLVFKVFENGANDLVYVGVKRGVWRYGEFDLYRFEKLIYTGRIDRTLRGHTLVNMGDVLPRPSSGLRVTRVTGSFK